MKAVYPGSFDPVTLGHVDLIKRGSRIFDELVVGVGDNLRKGALFSPEERVEFIKHAVKGIKNVKVVPFSSLLVEFARKESAHVILKGLRAVSDFDYELQMSLINRRMATKLETVFMMPSEEFSFVSSSLIKEIASHRGNVSSMVPDEVQEALVERLSQGKPTRSRKKKQ
ncbi:MAG: pantetheine-phosphate adenylyltransferase [Nitrospinota bacterium]|nr:pantetheine-phosphate adenylyltransferase [Nitrospinota bacterium]